MRRILILLPLLVGCHLGDLLSPADPPPEPPKCYLNAYVYHVDPVTKVRFDSSWVGSVEVPCPKS